MKYLKLLLLLSILIVSACGQRAPISPKEMEVVLSEMYYLDQLIEEMPGFRAQADSTEVYSSLLAKHGFTKEDYLNSVAYYLQDPERFEKIFKKAQARLEEKEKELRKEEEDRVASASEKPKEIKDLEEMHKDSSPGKKKKFELVDTEELADEFAEVPAEELAKVSAEESTEVAAEELEKAPADTLRANNRDTIPEIWVTREKVITEEDIKVLEEKFRK